MYMRRLASRLRFHMLLFFQGEPAHHTHTMDVNLAISPTAAVILCCDPVCAGCCKRKKHPSGDSTTSSLPESGLLCISPKRIMFGDGSHAYKSRPWAGPERGWEFYS